MTKLVTEIKTGLDFGSGIKPVGRLGMREGIIYFQYHDDFLQQGIEISPFRLPLQKGVIELPKRPFEGLAGVFSDSLPDGWGRLLFDRMVRAKGINPSDLSSLDRLAHVGLHGMGALVYEPDYSPTESHKLIDLDHLSTQAYEVLKGGPEIVIDELLALNGSSAGARPKALIGVHEDRNQIVFGAKQLEGEFEPWLVKFPNSQDGRDAGAIEYVYAQMAKVAGVSMPEVHLFPSQKGDGYFAVKRFDRTKGKKLHMHSVSGLLNSDFRTPSLDYEDLINLTGILTKDIREVEKMYRLAVFNVLAHNRDDHSKNFSFLMDESGDWKLAPAYDLTFSSGPAGEQSTMVMGEGKNPTLIHLVKLGSESKLPKKLIEGIIEETRTALNQWEPLAKNHGVSQENILLVSRLINGNP
ncbi:type II toxin-antitoxin system HipA family toxin [Algoriphagus sp.]|uniref:type II toxin-antitoxin system HipA family toxin n=1 Tax=Algoriphagus sp. TaxID=1872435 RepID=UPI003919E338